jgi:hypothetical protein
MSSNVEELEEHRDVLMDAIHQKYLEHLREGVCRVTFTKKDGTERNMTCTLDMDRVPEDHMPKTDGNRKEEGVVPESVRVYDLEKQGWRSFRMDSVTVFEPPKSLV